MPDIPVEGSGFRAYDPEMEARVARLEEDMREVKGVLSRLEPVIMRMDTFITATLPHLATKADVADLRTEMKGGLVALRSEMQQDQAALRSEMQQDQAALRSEMQQDQATLRSEMQQGQATLRLEMQQGHAALRIELAEKPSKTYMWGVLAVLITAYGAGLAALAILK